MNNHTECSDCLAKLLYGSLQQKQFRTGVEQYEAFRNRGADTSQVSPFITAVLYLGIRDSITALDYIKQLEDGSLEKISADKLLKSINEK